MIRLENLPKINIFDDNLKQGKILENILNNYHVPFEVDLLTYRAAKHFDTKAASLYFMVCSGDPQEDKSRLEIMSKLNRSTRAVLVAPRENFGSKLYTNALNMGLITNFLDTSEVVNPKRIYGLMHMLLEKIHYKEKIGLIGLGHLGTGLLSELLKNPSLEIIAQTTYLHGDYTTYEDWLEKNVSRVEFVKTIEEVINRNPYALILARGRQKENLKLNGNNILRAVFLRDSLGPSEEVFQCLKDYNGFTFIESNPSGSLALDLHRKYGHNPYKSSAAGADSRRNRAFISREILDVFGKKIYPENLYVPVFGEHGEQLTDINRVLYGGKFSKSPWHKENLQGNDISPRDLFEDYKLITKSEYRELLQSMCRKTAIRALGAAKSHHKFSYHEGTRIAVANTIKELVERKRFLTDSVYCFFSRKQLADIQENIHYHSGIFSKGAFLLAPAEVDYRKRTIKQNDKCRIEEMDETQLIEIIQQVESQYHILNKELARRKKLVGKDF